MKGSNVKVLSIQQPWAWAIVHLGKVENRSWQTGYRGPVLIHAGKSFSRGVFEDRAEYILAISGDEVPDPEALDFGGIIGAADLAHCLWRPEYGAARLGRPRKATRWHEPGSFGFYFENARPLPFRPCLAQLGLFDESALRGRKGT